ncbi:MAG: hypothetical protein M9894_05885 [Planctomycetes bacterium]|nr:hypothetical protein [Planctomycetota bacterium]
MTLDEALRGAYSWADQNASWVLAAGLALPVFGTVAARIGKGGRTDADGRLIASLVMGVALLAVILEVGCLFIARTALGADLTHANVLLVLAPIACLVGSVVGLRMVFPLSELGSVRTALDVAGFIVACAVVVWVASRFHFGVLFLGSLGQLLVIVLLAGVVLWRLWRRAIGGIVGDRTR